MNKWKRERQFELEWISDMIAYAKSINSNENSKEYQKALEEYVNSDRFKQFREEWESINGKLEDF